MSVGRLLWSTLAYHWRSNLAVFLGVVVGTAVLTGALLVGDSLRGSLRELTLKQLGWVDQALVTSRFFRQELASEVSSEHACPVLLLQGTVRADMPVSQKGSDKAEVHRAGKVTILGVDERFWHGDVNSGVDAGFWDSACEEIVLGAALADKLSVKPGDRVAVQVQKASSVARESWLGRSDTAAVVNEMRLTVAAILPEDSFGSRFNLHPSPVPVRNAFVPLRTLQNQLEVKNQVNAILVGEGAQGTQEALARHLTLADWGLELQTPTSRAEQFFAILDPRNRDGRLRKFRWEGRVPDALAKAAEADGILTRQAIVDYYRREHGYLSLESKQMLLEDAVGAVAEKAAAESHLRSAPTLVYLANTIAALRTELGAVAAALDPAPLTGLRLGGAESHRIPYSIVAALDPAQPSPLGPFLPPELKQAGLPEDSIVLVEWSESPLAARVGEPIVLQFFEPEKRGRLLENSALFTLAGRLPLTGPAYDPDLTPRFPGITDRLDIRTWDPPFPYDNKRIGRRDEDYWKKYRTTPKAYVTLKRGQELWSSRYGKLTSIRLAPADGGDLDQAAERFRVSLLKHLRPEQGGFVFDQVRKNSLEAGNRDTDFSGLFLGFSFFLIVSALLLVGLLFRLNLDRRASEVGLLLASGYRRLTVGLLLVKEGGVLAALAAVLGCAAAMLYAALMLELLNRLWPGAMDRSFLRLHTRPVSFAIGYVAAIAVSLLTIAWAVRVLAKVSPSALLRGETLSSQTIDSQANRRFPLATIVFIGSVLGAVACVIASGSVHDHELRAMTFFGSGAMLLTAGLTSLWKWMHGSRHQPVHGHGAAALARLGFRNASRHPQRSLLTAGLLASASFLLVAVDSFRRQPTRDFLDKNSGSGGFTLLAESDLPIFVDINTEDGRDKLNFSDRVRAALQGVTIYGFRLRAGDDASCLNLYQPRKPRLLGVPHAIVERGGFHFQATEASSESERQNPWLLLEQPAPDDKSVPVFGEANTVMWMLKKSLGGDVEVPDAFGVTRKLRITGTLKDSVFQSELLLSEANFLKLYPDQSGYNYFLIDVPPDRAAEVGKLLQTALSDFGFEVTPTAERLGEYLAVENTYLTTFQALGGLGLLLGALGLAVVLVRNVWERRGELALLRALGYRHRDLGWMIVTENAFLLTLGLGIGTLSALAAVAPHVFEEGGEIQLLRLLGLLAVVLLVGLSAGAGAVISTLRTPLIPALRRE